MSNLMHQQVLASVVAGPVFAAVWSARSHTLTVHTCSRKAAEKSRAAADGRRHDGMRVAVKYHSRRSLQSPRSLEALARIVEDGQIIHDPTQIFSRAVLLVDAVKAARKTFGSDIAGCHFDPASRTLLVVAAKRLSAERLAELGGALSAAVRAKNDELKGLAVRVATALPQAGDWMPVDAASVFSAGYWRRLVKGAAIAAISSAMLTGGMAHAKTETGVLGSLSVFADDGAVVAAEGFGATGISFFFGENGASSRVEVQLAQGGGNSGLRIVVNPERQVEDGPELRRPTWSPFTSGGAGPGS